MSRPDLDARTAAIRHAQRAGGQATALAGMIAADRPFPEIAQQLSAARGSLDALLIRLVDLELCLRVPNSTVADEVDGLLRAALGRTSVARTPLRPARDGAGTSSASARWTGRTTR
jgi:DNA-binding FrmR family transcriptional regulator